MYTRTDYVLLRAKEALNTMLHSAHSDVEYKGLVKKLQAELSVHTESEQPEIQMFLTRLDGIDACFESAASPLSASAAGGSPKAEGRAALIELEQALDLKHQDKAAQEQAYLADIASNHYEAVEAYLMQGGNPHVRDRKTHVTALHLAVEQKNLKLLVLILSYYKQYDLYIDVLSQEQEAFCFSPLSLACDKNNAPYASLLLKAGANPFRNYGIEQMSAYSHAFMMTKNTTSKVLDAYTHCISPCVSNLTRAGQAYRISFKTGAYGVSREIFFGEVAFEVRPPIVAFPNPRLLLEEVNQYFASHKIPLLVAKSDP